MSEQQDMKNNDSTPEQAQPTNNKWTSFKQEGEVEEGASVAENTADSGAALEHPSYDELEQKLTEIEQKAHEYKDKFLRSEAEKDNIQRRAERDISNAHKYAQDKLLNALLPVVDSLERAIDACQGDESHQVIVEGVELTLKLFLDTLEKQGLKQLNPLGEVFDPNFHEAISAQETQEVDSGNVLTVIQKGYKLHDRILRPALVVIAK